MLFRLILLLTLIPILELILLLQIHHALSTAWGPGPALLMTIGMIISTGIAGALLARWQGLGTLLKLHQAMSQGRFPAEPIMDGVMILIGAALLLTPGFVTDLLGFLLLLPWTRTGVRRFLKARIEQSIRAGDVQVVVVESTRSPVPPEQDGPVETRIP